MEGDKYEGQWKNGECHGQGTYYYFDEGGKYEGEWRDSERWNGKEYDKDGDLIGTFENGDFIEK